MQLAKRHFKDASSCLADVFWIFEDTEWDLNMRMHFTQTCSEFVAKKKIAAHNSCFNSSFCTKGEKGMITVFNILAKYCFSSRGAAMSSRKRRLSLRNKVTLAEIFFFTTVGAAIIFHGTSWYIACNCDRRLVLSPVWRRDDRSQHMLLSRW